MSIYSANIFCIYSIFIVILNKQVWYIRNNFIRILNYKYGNKMMNAHFIKNNNY